MKRGYLIYILGVFIAATLIFTGCFRAIMPAPGNESRLFQFLRCGSIFTIDVITVMITDVRIFAR
ncbi:MAG: hypothetical protein PWQ60_1898 [Thermoanaerobacteraceae bacterium]|jgi:hypothetical protein|nr:hypothetical protein [Thermoanaerobacteraceae bacterium]